MDLGIKGKKALVCAASRGLGFACAEALAAEGVDLYLLARDDGQLLNAKHRLSSHGVKVHWVSCDLAYQKSREHAIARVKSEWKNIDILIHNVGGPVASTVQETSSEAWHHGFQSLFMPAIEMNDSFLPGMKAQGWGRIITVTSLSAVEPIPMLAVSNALRSASTAMNKTLSDEVAQFGITVNCVAPGLIKTDRTEELMHARLIKSGQTREAYEADFRKSIPAGRMGRAEEYGAVVAFLCSEQASYITGSTIYVDGGKRRSTY